MGPAFKPAEPSQDLRVTPRPVLGLGVMLAGLVLALDSLGLVDGGALFRFWPLAIVAVGIVKWLSPAPQRMSAGIWIVAGVALLLVTMGHMSFAGVWATILFLVGAKIAWKALRPVAAPTDPAAALDLLQFMGGTKTVVTTTDFNGGIRASTSPAPWATLASVRPGWAWARPGRVWWIPASTSLAPRQHRPGPPFGDPRGRRLRCGADSGTMRTRDDALTCVLSPGILLK